MYNLEIYYVYMYLRNEDSKIAKSGTPYYIGKGKDDRAFIKHIGVSVPKDKSKIVFVATNLKENDAFNLEINEILKFGRIDIDIGTGILRNLTNGGDGPSGRKHTISARKKMSKSHIGKTQLDETKLKIKLSSINRAPTPKEAKLKMSISAKNKTPITCPHCKKSGNGNSMYRWHFDKCNKIGMSL